MEKVSAWRILEVTYRYASEQERDVHKQWMLKDGYTVAVGLPFFKNDLVVTYQMRNLEDNIARL